MIERKVCPNCNSTLVSIGNGKLKCPACRSVFDDTSVSDEEKPLLIAASKLLRDGDFDGADESFRDIIDSYPRNHEAYYGRALARHGIVFVNDVRAGEGKKVPTCYITDIGSFIEDPCYKKALEYAPDEVKEEYEKQGKLIEDIIVEWRDKASKQSFDIFISFKASEDSTGGETQDSIEAAKLYTFLAANKNYKVFFAPETLRSFTSERYEPYIFNALNSAPVMIVYGQSQEHLEATWVRNEWSRFIKKIQTGEKEPNALVVCYENMLARDLPNEFKNIQCMDASKKTFYIDLCEHIEKVLEKARKPKAGIQTIQTEYGKVGKKVKKLNYNEVKTYTLGSTTAEKVNETDEFILDSAKKYFEHGMIDEAKGKLEQFLANNEYNYEAHELKLLADNKCKVLSDFISRISTKENVDKIKFLISLATKEKALEIIELLTTRMGELFANFNDVWIDIFKTLAELDFEKNKEMRYAIVNKIIDSKAYSKMFDEFICFIDNNDVDFHIQSRLCLISKGIKGEYPELDYKKYIDEVSEIDEGNTDNLVYKLLCDFGASSFEDALPAILTNQTLFLTDVENILKYSKEKDAVSILSKYIAGVIKYISVEEDNTKIALALHLFDTLIRYLPSTNNKFIAKPLEELCNLLYKKKYYDGCIEYSHILLNYTDKKDDVVFLTLMCKLKCPNYSAKDEIKFCDQKINSFDEWNILMTSTNKDYETKLFELLDKQIEEDKNKAKTKKALEESKEIIGGSFKGLMAKKRTLRFSSVLVYLITSLIFIALSVGICFVGFYFFKKMNLNNEKLSRILVNIFTPLLGVVAIMTAAPVLFEGKHWKKRNAFRYSLISLIGLAAIAQLANMKSERIFIVTKSYTVNMYIATAGFAFIAVIVGSIFAKLVHSKNFISLPYRKLDHKYKTVKNTISIKKDTLTRAEKYFEKLDSINMENLNKYDKYNDIKKIKLSLENEEKKENE